MNKEIFVDKDIILTKSFLSDKQALFKYLNDKEIFDQTLKIPYPYTQADAETTLNLNLSFEEKNNVRRNWVIRRNNGKFMGHVGLHYPYGIESEKNEIYYWLGKPFRNKGIMTKVISSFAKYCFGNLKIVRLEAPIFDFNIASESILLKNDFYLEKELPNHYKKGDKLISAKMYVKQANT